MMITPQGANLFLEWAPVIASGLAAAVATYAVLGHEPDPADAGPGGREPIVSAP
jgi:hypothetical protein